MSSKAQAPEIPPGEQTIGQLVADALRFYGSHFWASLVLGIGPAILTVTAATAPRDVQIAVLLVGWPVLMTTAYVVACFLVLEQPFSSSRLAKAGLIGFAIALPVPLLVAFFILPAVLWLALAGLAVPVAIVEGTEFRESVRRGFALGRADYIHAAGTLATLVLLVALTQLALFQLLHGLSQNAVVVAAFLASVVVSPLLFIGSAFLYSDQRARAEGEVESSKT